MTKNIIASGEGGQMFFERMRTGAIGSLWERNFGAEANYSVRTKERAKDLEKRRRALTASIRP